MSLGVAVSLEGVRVPLSRLRVSTIVRAVLRGEGVPDALVSVTFVSTARIRRLNRAHLGRSAATDVIAFGFRRERRQAPVVGDVYIAVDVARASAIAHDVPIREELTRLVVHGTLHVLGYDHPDGASRVRSRMWKRQEELVDRLARRTR